MLIPSLKEQIILACYHFLGISLAPVEVVGDYVVDPILELRQCVHSSVEVFIIAIMKTHKFIPCFKSQKSLKQELKREEFFDELIAQVDRLFTPEEHEYLTTFLLNAHHHANSRNNPPEHAPMHRRPSLVPRVQESPLIHIKEDVFRDVKRTLKRVATLTQDSPAAQERSRLVFTSTAKKKPREREYMQTMIARDQNKAGTPLACSKRENNKPFKINRFKKGKYADSKSCDKLLRDRKVLQAYDNNFLQEVLATNDSTYVDQFSERYLTALPKDKEPVYALIQSQKLAEEEKLRSINCLQFSRTPGRSRTAIKLYRRKY